MNRRPRIDQRLRPIISPVHGGVDTAEFHRIRRRLGLALLALLIVVTIGVIGFLIIGRGRHVDSAGHDADSDNQPDGE